RDQEPPPGDEGEDDEKAGERAAAPPEEREGEHGRHGESNGEGRARRRPAGARVVQRRGGPDGQARDHETDDQAADQPHSPCTIFLRSRSYSSLEIAPASYAFFRSSTLAIIVDTGISSSAASAAGAMGIFGTRFGAVNGTLV